MVFEVAHDALVVDDPARGSDVALLHGEHHVVLQSLGRAFYQDVVGWESGRADAKALAADDVLYLVGQAPEALRFGDRLQIFLVGRVHPGSFGVVELASPGTATEPPLDVVVDQGQVIEQVDAGIKPGFEQYLLDLTVRGIQPQRVLVVAVALHEVAHLLHVGPYVHLDQGRDISIRDRLHPGQQGHAGDHPLDVPGEVAQVGLVEIVDVEDEHPVAGHVGAEVLRVQVALDPDSAGALIRPRVDFSFHVRIEQARAATIEGERVGGHLPELLTKRLGVRDHELGERVDQHIYDLRLTLFGGLVVPSLIHGSSHGTPFIVELGWQTVPRRDPARACAQPQATGLLSTGQQKILARSRTFIQFGQTLLTGRRKFAYHSLRRDP